MIKQMEVGFCWVLILLWAFGMDFEYSCTVSLREVNGLQNCSKALRHTES